MGEAYLDMVSLLLTWPFQVPVHGDAMKPMLVFHSWLPRTILPWFWSPCISIDSLQERSREGQKLDMYNTLHCWRCVPKLTLDHASEVWDGTPQSQFRLIAKTCVWFGIKSGPPGSEAEERLQILLQHLKSQAVARHPLAYYILAHPASRSARCRLETRGRLLCSRRGRCHDSSGDRVWSRTPAPAFWLCWTWVWSSMVVVMLAAPGCSRRRQKSWCLCWIKVGLRKNPHRFNPQNDPATLPIGRPLATFWVHCRIRWKELISCRILRDMQDWETDI